jgi:polygalacturonase
MRRIDRSGNPQSSSDPARRISMPILRRKLIQNAWWGAIGAVLPFRDPRAQTAAALSGVDVRAFGAAGDAKADDTAAINRAIAAAEKGGGTVRFPPGTYRSYSIRLRSFLTLYLETGATILAATTPASISPAGGGYDPAESNAPWEAFQDFGHNHWHNSLIWGEDIHDIAILGPGRIWGMGLSRGDDDPDLPREAAPGAANKAIALKNCRNVLFRDFTILAGGHFGILATGVDNLTVDNVLIDTNRDGMNIDCCRNVRIVNCSVNSPWDDGICLKSSYSLGYARPTENVSIANCYLSGNYLMGALLDGTYRRFASTFDGQATGRIKFGTESNGGFRNIAITNCIFESCRGLALETVDGGILEDVTITGVTMRDIRNAPIYLRLGSRMRGPAGVRVGRLRRVQISNVVSYGPANTMPVIISGVPGHSVDDIKISEVHLIQQGGGTAELARIRPPEQENEYPEPARLGSLPSQHFFIRHARNIELSNITMENEQPDARPVFWLEDVTGFDAFRLRLPQKSAGPAFFLSQVKEFRVFASHGIADTSLPDAPNQQI